MFPFEVQGNPVFNRGFQEVFFDFLKSPVGEGIPLHLEGEHTCPVDRGAYKGFPHNPLQSELKLRNLVAPHT